jgi:hypothetical protein
MKRIIIWVDTKSEEFEQVLKKLKKSLDSMGVKYSIVDVHELVELGETK